MFWSWASSPIGAPQDFEHYVAAGVRFPSAVPFTWFGWVGVEIFFVISGFVVANSASKSSATEFLFGRALRLYPAVWVCATLTLIVLLLFASGPASELVLPYVRAMLLIPKGVGGQWIDCIYWTLAAEMAFYGLVFCALLTKKITLRHLAWGLTIYSGLFNGFAMLVLSGVIKSQIFYFVVLMFRVPCAAWLLCHGCFFALGIWLFISASRKLTALEQFAVAATCLSGCAEIFFFSSYLLTNVPAISAQSALVPIVVWAAAVSLIAIAANRSRRTAGTVLPGAAGHLRTLGLITYPLYLIHNVVGSAIIRVLIDAGLDASLAVGASLPWLKVAHLAETFNIPICPHFLMELHVSLCAAVPNAAWVEWIPQLDTITSSRLTIERGKARPPSEAGIGIAWDWQAIAKLQAFTPIIVKA